MPLFVRISFCSSFCLCLFFHCAGLQTIGLMKEFSVSVPFPWHPHPFDFCIMRDDFRCAFDLRVYLCLHCIEINTSESEREVCVCVCVLTREGVGGGGREGGVLCSMHLSMSFQRFQIIVLNIIYYRGCFFLPPFWKCILALKSQQHMCIAANRLYLALVNCYNVYRCSIYSHLINSANDNTAYDLLMALLHDIRVQLKHYKLFA